eukprot:2474625-Amphidinium_carterae.1
MGLPWHLKSGSTLGNRRWQQKRHEYQPHPLPVALLVHSISAMFSIALETDMATEVAQGDFATVGGLFAGLQGFYFLVSQRAQ